MGNAFVAAPMQSGLGVLRHGNLRVATSSNDEVWSSARTRGRTQCPERCSMHESSWVETNLEVECDASSAIAITAGRDLERRRHMEGMWLWFQQLVNAGCIRIVKGTENVPDVGTKFLGKRALDTSLEGLELTHITSTRAGVAGVLTNPTHVGSAILMLLITGVRAASQGARTCWISWTVLIVWELLSVMGAIVIDRAYTRPAMLRMGSMTMPIGCCN